MTTFTYTDAELDFGTHSLGGDWTLTIRSDDSGRTFKLVDAETCLKGVSRACFALIQEWIEDDAAKAGKSLIRKAYEEAQPDDGQSYVYTAPADYRSIWRAA